MTDNTSAARAPQPGWYAAPNEPGFEREWNGTAWTEARRPQATPGRGSVGALVCGILALITSPVIIGLVLGIVAIVLGSRRDPQAGISRAGKIMGLIAVILTVLIAVASGVANMSAPY